MAKRIKDQTNGTPVNNGHATPPGGMDMGLIMLQQLVNNATMSRREMFSGLMDSRRDTNVECGYPETHEVTVQKYKNLYDREAVASRVVEVFPKECWQATPEVYEDEDAEVQTPFEIAWDQLSDSLRGDSWYKTEQGSPIWEALQRADVLSGIGHFGVILLGFDDGLELHEPVEFVARKVDDDESGKGSPQGTDAQYSGGHQSPYGDDYTMKQFGHGKEDAEDEDDEFADLDDEPTKTEPDNGDPVDKDDPDADEGAEDEDDFGLDDGEGDEEDSLGEDVKEVEKEVKTKRKLMYIRVFDESLVQITRYIQDKFNPRYGQPEVYSITLNDPKDQHSGTGLALATVEVHWTRVIHIADNLGSSEIFGVPRMRPVLNRILDLVKLYGGSAEMYWRGAFPGLSLETHPQLGGDVSIDMTAAASSMEKYMNTLQRYLINEGMTVKTLSPTVVDPSTQIDTQITGICIQIGTPKRIFLGSERGELASGQDDTTWNGRCKGRQQNYITPKMIVPFVNRLIAVGCLPEPKEYFVEWPDLDALQPVEKAQIALSQTQAIGAYVSGGCDVLISPLDFFTRVLGFSEEEAEAILEATTQHLEEAHPDAEEDVVPGKDPTPPEQQVMINPKTGEPIELKPGQVAAPGGGAGEAPPFGKKLGKEGDDEFPPKGKKPNKWAGKTKPPFVRNVYCPTGEGGGVDPSCSPGISGGQRYGAATTKEMDDAIRGLDQLEGTASKYGDAKPPFPRKKHPYAAGDAAKRRSSMTTATVDIDDLIATQPAVESEHVKRYIKDLNHRGDRSKDEFIDVVKYSGRLYIDDGTHRATALKLMGRKKIDINLIDLDSSK